MTTPEARLVFEIARPALSPSGRQRIAALVDGGVDWDLVHRLASRHRVGMFLYRHLDAMQLPGVPKAVFMDLWRSYEQNARANAARVEELRQVTDLLSAAGIPVVVYKGPLLAQQLYGDVTMREFEDLDLLVRPVDVARVKALLCAASYDVADDMTEHAEAYVARSGAHYHRCFVHRGTGALLEVHWKTDVYFPVEQQDDQWWASRPSVRLGGAAYRTFDDSELLLLLCLHLVKHQGHRLGWLVEIGELTNRANLDWTAVEDAATRLRCRRRVAIALKLAADSVAAPVPPEILAAERASRRVIAATAAMRARLAAPELDELQSLPRLRLNLLMFDDLALALRHTAEVAFAPTEHEFHRGWPILGAYGFLPPRIGRLLRKYAFGRSA